MTSELKSVSGQRYGEQAVWIRSACLAEAAAPKLGNVHPGAGFADATYEDFARSADVAAPSLADAGSLGIGRAILDAVQATQNEVGTNTNLGIALLMAPLAAISPLKSMKDGIGEILESLTIDDARSVYKAIQIASPAGLGATSQEDVSVQPTRTLRDVMSLAADRDRIARQYAVGFGDVLSDGVHFLMDAMHASPGDWSDVIVRLQLKMMATWPDSLIARKCGPGIAENVRVQAEQLLDRGFAELLYGDPSVRKFDQYLRSDGNRLNPGTTADLVAAVLYVAQREQIVSTNELLSIVPNHEMRERSGRR